MRTATAPATTGGAFTYSGWLRKATEQSNGTLVIEGIASSDQFDCDNERVDIPKSWVYFERMRARMQESSNGKSVLPLRLQHNSKKIAGRVTDLWRSDGEIWARAVVEDPQAVALVRSGSASQLSFGGRYVSREQVGVDEAGYPLFDIVMDPMELSLVDAGCNFEARITDVRAKGVEAFELYKRDGRMEMIRAQSCGCAACQKARLDSDEGVEDYGDEITFDVNLWTREDAVAWLLRNGFEADQYDLEDLGDVWIFEKLLKGAKAMNASDHSHLAKLNRRLASFHKSMADTCNEVAAHHENLAGLSGEGIRNPRGFGDVTPNYSAARKSFYDPGPVVDPDNDPSGGLVRKLV
jgi:hypothetical protein